MKKIEIEKLFRIYDKDKFYVDMDIYKEYKVIVFKKEEEQHD